MDAVKRSFLALLCSMTLLHLASAQTNDSETPPPAEGSLPTIHRRAATPEADALGPPPKFVAAPPLDVSKLSLEECAALAPEIMRYMAYENEKSLWNLRKIAGTGSPYDLSVCKAADEAFDNAANASGSPGKNFDLAAKTAYAKGTECRNALDAFYAKECAASEDADCRTAEADKREADFLDDQNTKFLKDLPVRKQQEASLASCGDNHGAKSAGETRPERTLANGGRGATVALKTSDNNRALQTLAPTLSRQGVASAAAKDATRTQSSGASSSTSGRRVFPPSPSGGTGQMPSGQRAQQVPGPNSSVAAAILGAAPRSQAPAQCPDCPNKDYQDSAQRGLKCNADFGNQPLTPETERQLGACYEKGTATCLVCERSCPAGLLRIAIPNDGLNWTRCCAPGSILSTSGNCATPPKPVVCTGGKVWNGTSCACPAGQPFIGGNCTKCPAGQASNKSGTACSASCNGTLYDPSSACCNKDSRTPLPFDPTGLCKCDGGGILQGGKCRCPDGKPATTGTCGCPSGTEPDNIGGCSKPCSALERRDPAGRCEPKPGPDGDPRTIPNQKLSPLQQQKVDQAQAVLDKLDTGLDLKATIAAEYQAKTFKGGEVRVAKENLRNGFAKTYTKDGITIIVLSPEVFDKAVPASALVPLLAHEERHGLDDCAKNFGGDPVLPEFSAYLTEIHAARELEEQHLLCQDAIPLCQATAAYLRVWKDNFRDKDNDLKGTESYGYYQKWVERAQDDEFKSNARGTRVIYNRAKYVVERDEFNGNPALPPSDQAEADRFENELLNGKKVTSDTNFRGKHKAEITIRK